MGERLALGKAEALALDLSNAPLHLGPLVYIASEWSEGKKSNLTDCNIYIDGSDCYRVSGAVYAKNCGLCFWPKSSEYAFGCDTLFSSSACIRCFYSTKLTRCFEMDACSNCSDSLFCHNCENLTECMFCFNVKGKRYAIANVEYPKEEYLLVKKKLLCEMAITLQKEQKLGLDIYSIGGI